MAEEMLPIFEAQDVHQEALAALALFQEAARQDQLTVKRALEVVAYLREARGEPEVRDSEPVRMRNEPVDGSTGSGR